MATAKKENLNKPGKSLKGKIHPDEEVIKVIQNHESSHAEKAKGEQLPDVLSLLKKGEKTDIPLGVQPMLATLVDKPFDGKDWAFEIKWDGYRAIAFAQGDEVQLSSRNSKSFNEKFYPILEAIQKLKLNAVLDGEIVVLNKKGMADFSNLQAWRSEADGSLAYYVFDLLWVEGTNLMNLPYAERRAILKSILPDNQDDIRLSQVYEDNGLDFFEAANQMGFEGIIAKRKDSTYQSETRSKDWLKIKTDQRQEAVIGGYTLNENSPKKFSALLMGMFENGVFKYIGQVGTGYTAKLQEEVLEKLAPHITDKCPFPVEPEYNKPSRFRPNPPKASVTWVKPVVVGEVSFREMTRDGVMRHPSFKGLREDKLAKDVILEKLQPVKKVVTEDNKAFRQEEVFTAPKNVARKSLLNPTDETQTRELDGHLLKFGNLSKLYWPEDKVSKRDLLNYYYQVAPYMVPHLKDRPQSMHRFPNGIHGMRFYQKNVVGKVPDWIETYPYVSEGEHKEMLVCCNDASLLYMASLGCIEMNPFFSRKQSVDYPDYCVIDLDPDKNTFEQVIVAAQVVKKVLDALDVPSYCKTSGSTGIHV